MEQFRHQCIFIRGGESFDNKEEFYSYLKKREYDPYLDSKRWTNWLQWSLEYSFDSFIPQMPNKQWADYTAWKIWFEKLLPYINDEEESKIVLVGQSLGALFLMKYLSEEGFNKQISQLHLVCPYFNNEGLIDEKTTTFELNLSNISNVEKIVNRINIYHSKDDPFSPFSHSLKYLKYLPKAQFFEYENKGHFDEPTFVDLLNEINKELL